MFIYSEERYCNLCKKRAVRLYYLLLLSGVFCCTNTMLLLFYISMSGNRVGGFQNLLGSPPQSGGIQELDEPVPDRKTLYTGDWRCL